MFEYTQRDNRTMGFDTRENPKLVESIELGNKIIFVHDFLHKYEGILVIAIYDKTTKSYDRIISSIKLKLKIHDIDDKIDFYELDLEKE